MNSKFLKKKLLEFVKEDVGEGDVTTTLTKNRKVKAKIIAKSSGIVSGTSELKILFRLFEIAVLKSFKEGKNVKPGQIIFLLKGPSHNILEVERTSLNILSRMSGISTLTNELVKIAKKTNPKIKIAATRKTTPSFSYFEKRAVEVGGGDTHRLGLYDMVLIKDNHLQFFKNVKEAVKKAKKETSFSHKIEIEVCNKEEAIAAASEGADIIMLDNFSPQKIKETIKELEKKKLRKKTILEASGGITLKNVKDYAKTGVDVISIGVLTHSAPALDFSLKII